MEGACIHSYHWRSSVYFTRVASGGSHCAPRTHHHPPTDYFNRISFCAPVYTSYDYDYDAYLYNNQILIAIYNLTLCTACDQSNAAHSTNTLHVVI